MDALGIQGFYISIFHYLSKLRSHPHTHEATPQVGGIAVEGCIRVSVFQHGESLKTSSNVSPLASEDSDNVFGGPARF